MFKGKKLLIAAGKEKVFREDVIEVLKCVKSIKETFEKRRFLTDIFYIQKKDFTNPLNVISTISKFKPLCVFNLFEGFSNDSQKEIDFVKILEKVKVPFTGNTSYTLDICRNKQKVKDILKKNNISVPQGILVKKTGDWENEKFDPPLFIKPCCEDASLGIDEKSLVEKKENIYEIIQGKLRKFPEGVIIEEFIHGKEYSVGLLGSYPYEVLGISVIDYTNYNYFSPFMSYKSKWNKKSQEFKILLPSNKEKINKGLKKRIIDISLRAGSILRCYGYFRVDLREKNGELFVLDINPNPDINIDSGFMKQAYNKGYTYQDIIEKIINFTLVS